MSRGHWLTDSLLRKPFFNSDLFTATKKVPDTFDLLWPLWYPCEIKKQRRHWDKSSTKITNENSSLNVVKCYPPVWSWGFLKVLLRHPTWILLNFDDTNYKSVLRKLILRKYRRFRELNLPPHRLSGVWASTNCRKFMSLGKMFVSVRG